MVNNGIWWLIGKWIICPNHACVSYITFIKTKINF